MDYTDFKLSFLQCVVSYAIHPEGCALNAPSPMVVGAGSAGTEERRGLGLGTFPSPLRARRRPHTLSTALGMSALLVTGGTEGTRWGAVAGLPCERCGTEKGAGERMAEGHGCLRGKSEG